MVSIHRVPVIAYLIIRVIYFTFRFKTWNQRLSVPHSEALAIAHCRWTDNARVHAEYDITHPSNMRMHPKRIQSWLSQNGWITHLYDIRPHPKGHNLGCRKMDVITTPYGHLPLQSSRRQYCKFARFQNVLKPCVSKRLSYVRLPSPTQPPAIKTLI